MSRPRTVPPTLEAPVHGGAIKRCAVLTEVAIHTIALPEGHFAAIVFSNPAAPFGAMAIIDKDEAEAQIQLLKNGDRGC